jgi:hypothetical protein
LEGKKTTQHSGNVQRTYSVNYTFWCLIAKMAPTVFISRFAAVESGMCGSSSGGWHSCLESYHDSSMACSTVTVASAPSSTLCMRSHSLSLFRRHRTHLQHKQTKKKIK